MKGGGEREGEGGGVERGQMRRTQGNGARL